MEDETLSRALFSIGKYAGFDTPMIAKPAEAPAFVSVSIEFMSQWFHPL
jgi:hypothetical protein